jgi:hypothetical protein
MNPFFMRVFEDERRLVLHRGSCGEKTMITWELMNKGPKHKLNFNIQIRLVSLTREK